MTASTVHEQPIAETPVVEETPAPPSGFFARLIGRWRPRPAPAPPAVATPAAVTVAAVSEPDSTEQAALAAALDSLGQAHHRPFSQH